MPRLPVLGSCTIHLVPSCISRLDPPGRVTFELPFVVMKRRTLGRGPSFNVFASNSFQDCLLVYPALAITRRWRRGSWCMCRDRNHYGTA